MGILQSVVAIVEHLASAYPTLVAGEVVAIPYEEKRHWYGALQQAKPWQLDGLVVAGR
jgi:hypothetical protein